MCGVGLARAGAGGCAAGEVRAVLALVMGAVQGDWGGGGKDARHRIEGEGGKGGAGHGGFHAAPGSF